MDATGERARLPAAAARGGDRVDGTDGAVAGVKGGTVEPMQRKREA